MWFNKKEEKKEDTNFYITKSTNEEYLKSMQKFLDLCDNIKNEELKNTIIKQMLMCDKILTEIAEQELKEHKNVNK